MEQSTISHSQQPYLRHKTAFKMSPRLQKQTLLIYRVSFYRHVHLTKLLTLSVKWMSNFLPLAGQQDKIEQRLLNVCRITVRVNYVVCFVTNGSAYMTILESTISHLQQPNQRHKPALKVPLNLLKKTLLIYHVSFTYN